MRDEEVKLKLSQKARTCEAYIDYIDSITLYDHH